MFSGAGRDWDAVRPDTEALAASASQTGFLYTLGWLVWDQYGKQVEQFALKLFVRGLTSDQNQVLALRRSRARRVEVERRMAVAFCQLSEIVSERPSLAREALLTGFSIAPNQKMFDKIKVSSLSITLKRW